MEKKITLDLLKLAGIEIAGFCGFDILKDRLLKCRAQGRIPSNAKTVICCAFPYKVKEEPPKNISRYAAVCDYHPVLQRILGEAAKKLKERFPENEFECFVDNSPIPEVFAAACSGIGKVGDNGLLTTKRYGSWVFLGEIVTDLEIKSENLYSECLHCKRCKEVCPKGELGCLSEVSQKKAELSNEEKTALKNNKLLWGCDICAEVCPLNKGAKINPLEEFKNGYRDSFAPNEDTEGRPYMWRTQKVIQRNYKIIYE